MSKIIEAGMTLGRFVLPKCAWFKETEESVEYFTTACNNVYLESTHEFEYCPYCGRRIKHELSV